jgi:hypothetical protein
VVNDDALLLALAETIDETIREADEWAKNNTQAYAQEIFISQVAVSGTLKLLSSKLRSLSQRQDNNG